MQGALNCKRKLNRLLKDEKNNDSRFWCLFLKSSIICLSMFCGIQGLKSSFVFNHFDYIIEQWKRFREEK
jgi:hypothetical protein